jgi:hypothetical protein
MLDQLFDLMIDNRNNKIENFNRPLIIRNKTVKEDNWNKFIVSIRSTIEI